MLVDITVTHLRASSQKFFPGIEHQETLLISSTNPHGVKADGARVNNSRERSTVSGALL
jgi:hypothetical protein